MKIYLDHAATTAVDKDVLEQMTPYFDIAFGNASSLHQWGQQAENAVDRARETVAECLGAAYNEVYFTSGGTESDNWAVKGVIAGNKAKGKHIVTTAIEHHAVLESVRYLQKAGVEATIVAPDRHGRVCAEDVVAAIRPDTVLVSVMAANNEVGTLQPIAAVGQACRERGVLFHTDAVQAVGHVAINVRALHIDLLSLSAHKFGGPKGVGALYVREGVSIDNLLSGGMQERNLRAGTYNTPAIVGLGAAIAKATADLEKNHAHVSALRKAFVDGVTERVSDVCLNGDSHDCLPGIVNLCFDGVDGGALLARLDMEGIAIGRGSACNAGSVQPSHVLAAMGRSTAQINSSVRFSFGPDNTMDEVNYVVERLADIVPRLRRL